MNKSYVTVTELGSGWAAILLWWNQEDGGFWEPFNTGFGRYATKEEAELEARGWANSEGLEYK